MVPCERTGHLFPFVSPGSLSLISLLVFNFDITYARSETDPGDPGSEGPEHAPNWIYQTGGIFRKHLLNRFETEIFQHYRGIVYSFQLVALKGILHCTPPLNHGSFLKLTCWICTVHFSLYPVSRGLFLAWLYAFVKSFLRHRQTNYATDKQRKRFYRC